MGSTGENEYGEFTYENLEREPYWPSEKLRISITGAGGFIASHIARRLKSEGHYIIASDWKKNEHMNEEMFCHEFHLVDLRVMDNCLKVTTGVDHVFNLAADMGGMGFIQSNHSVIMYNNTMISFNMLEAARVNGVKRFFYASSACIYPEFKQLETTNVSLKESDAWPAEPQDAYGLEKLASEELCKHYTKDFEIECRIGRFHNIYGPFGTWKGGRESTLSQSPFHRKQKKEGKNSILQKLLAELHHSVSLLESSRSLPSPPMLRPVRPSLNFWYYLGIISSPPWVFSLLAMDSVKKRTGLVAVLLIAALVISGSNYVLSMFYFSLQKNPKTGRFFCGYERAGKTIGYVLVFFGNIGLYYYSEKSVASVLTFLFLAFYCLSTLFCIQPYTDFGVLEFLLTASMNQAFSLVGIHSYSSWLVIIACIVIGAMRYCLEPVHPHREATRDEVQLPILSEHPPKISASSLPFGFLTRMRKRRYTSIKEDNVGVRSLKYDLGTIQAATNNFSNYNKIGEGGFGVVYKGSLPDGKEVAVKRLSRTSGQAAQEFKNEVGLVANLQHRNLVRLLGFCLGGDEKILVYEFVHNRGLDYFLFDPQERKKLDWSRRYKIIGGVAQGMLYLHEESQLGIIHGDLKASNILLDVDINAKVSDFGTARILRFDRTQANTTQLVGSFGYMSPEYAIHGQFSKKSDVFSFGVIVLEIISGKNNSFYHSAGALDLPSHAWQLWREGTPVDLMDLTLEGSFARNEVIRCIHIALLCIQTDPNDRPSMATIVQMLNSYSVTLSLPQQPRFLAWDRTR